MTIESPETFIRPLYLLFGLPILIYIVAVALLGRGVLRRFFRPVVVILRCGICCGILYLIAGPAGNESERAPVRVEVVVDASRSLGPTGRIAAAKMAVGRLRDLASVEPEITARVVRFGRHAEVIHDGPLGPSEEAAIEEALLAGADGVDQTASRPGPALLLAAEGAPAGADRLRIIIGDGSWPSPDGIRPLPGRTVLIAPPVAADTGRRVLDVEGPSVVEEGRPIALTAVVEASAAADVNLAVSVRGREIKSVPVRLESGVTRVSIEGIELPAGDHGVVVRVVPADGEPSDDLSGIGVHVAPKRHVLYLNDGPTKGLVASAGLRALRVQKLNIEAMKPDAAPLEERAWDRVAAVVLDGLPASRVSSALSRRIRAHVESGGGLLFWPGKQPGSLLEWNEHELADLLPFTALPEPPRREKNKSDDKQKAKKLSKPDPAKSKVVKVKAPTLSMLLLIDKSSSMRDGGKLANAKKGAIATARELHPKDRIGVIVYNDTPNELVPIQPAANLPNIEKSIQRLRADGATNIEAALDYGREVLGRDDAAVKVMVLLSDGFARPFDIQAVAEKLAAEGISITTIGVGSKFDRATLTQIAFYGGGIGPIPAYSARELPKLMVDVTSRLQKDYKTRTRKKPEKKDPKIHRPEARIPRKADSVPPKPPAPGPGNGQSSRNSWPIVTGRASSYLDGLEFEPGPRIRGIHRVRPKGGVQVSLGAGDVSRPMLAHWSVGFGRVAMWSLPSEGEWAEELALWGKNPVLQAQLTRFLKRDPAMVMLSVTGLVLDDGVMVEVEALASREPPAVDRLQIELADDLGPVDVSSADPSGPGRALLRTTREFDGPFVRLTIRTDDGREHVRYMPRPPMAEVRHRGLDLEGLESWRRAIDGEILNTNTGDVLSIERTMTSRPSVLRTGLAVFLLGLFGIELLMKRMARKERR